MKKGESTPVVVATRRRWPPDLSFRVLQESRQSGQALRRENELAEQRGMGLDTETPMLQLVQALKNNSDIEIALKVLKLGFVSRVINLTAGTPSEIIQRSKYPRGYIIINPAEISGFTTNVTFFASAARAVGTYTSGQFNVSGVDRVSSWLDVSVNGAGGSVQIDVQSIDPLSGNAANAQIDIFNVATPTPVNTYYANLGQLGVDRLIQMFATVATAGPVTFSVSGLLKGGAVTPTGSTVYIGDQNVTSTIGYPILPGQREYFWLGDDVQLFAVSPTEPVTLKVFQLQ